jgi:DDE superfamily endonuclease
VEGVRDPERETKLDRIEQVTSSAPDRCFAFDQFGPLSIRPCHGSSWATQKHADRLPATYRRTHGIRYFHGCYSLGDDQLWGVTRRRKGAHHSLSALRSIRAVRPDGEQPYVILDNLSTNKTPAIRRWAKRNKVELCFTPTSASWANPIEAQFGPLRSFVLGDSNHPNHAVLARKLQGYLRWRNANARHPEVLAAQRRERPACAASASASGAGQRDEPHDLRECQPATRWLAGAARLAYCLARCAHTKAWVCWDLMILRNRAG